MAVAYYCLRIFFIFLIPIALDVAHSHLPAAEDPLQYNTILLSPFREKGSA